MSASHLFLYYPAVPISFILVLTCLLRWFLSPRDQRRTELILLASLFCLPATMLAEYTVIRLSALRPWKYDEFVYRFDLWLGEPSFYLGRLAKQHRIFDDTISVSYGLLPIAMIAVLAIFLYLRESEVGIAVKAFALNLLAALPIYLLFPVCGPQFAFPTFPDAPPAFTAHPLLLSAPPNGVPSVHASTAILILLFLWPWTWGKIAGSIFLVLTILATLASGQHYAFDLLCSIPYSWAVWKAAHFSMARRGLPSKSRADQCVSHE